MEPPAAGCAEVDSLKVVLVLAVGGLKDPCLAEWEAQAMRAL